MTTDIVEPIINQYAQSYVDKIKFIKLDLGDIVN